MIKPSELTPKTSEIISKIISTVFHKNHVEVIEGGIEVPQRLLRNAGITSFLRVALQWVKLWQKRRPKI